MDENIDEETVDVAGGTDYLTVLAVLGAGAIIGVGATKFCGKIKRRVTALVAERQAARENFIETTSTEKV